MTDKKLPTIKLQGNDYVLVKDRILAFHELYPTGFIQTEVELHGQNEGYAVVRATVYPHAGIANERGEELITRTFTGHSGGPIAEDKSLEKLETVAVGRALAFLGIGIIESIASADEITAFENRKAPKNVPMQPVGGGENYIDPVNLQECAVCGSNYKYIPSGISKAGKAYSGFYCCSQRGCKGKTFGMDVAAQMVRKDYKEPEVPMPEEY